MRVGIVGQRGRAFASALRAMDGVELSALCNIDRQALHSQADVLAIPERYENFDDLLENVDAVVVSTPMQLHAAQSIAALEAGVHVLSEVTAAVTLDECRELKAAAERAARRGVIYAMAENYCYLKPVVLVKELVRRGMFGELYFAEGEYLHEVRNYHHNLDGSPTWRYHFQVGTPGVTYGTHSLGPAMQWFKALDPNEKIESVVCLGSGVHTDPEHPHDDTSLMLCKLKSGKLIKIRLDMMSNRPNQATFYALQGTKGVFESSRTEGQPGSIWLGENAPGEHRVWRPLDELSDFLPERWKNPPTEALRSGHGGSDWFVAEDFVRACRGEMAPDCGIDDALEWTAAGLCSTISLQNGGAPVQLPDFTRP